MKRLPWGPPVLTLICVVLLAIATGFLDASRFWGLRLDRGAAVDRAREIAASYGLDAEGWDASATITVQDRIRRFLEAAPEEQEAALLPLTPVYYQVRLEDGASDARLEVAFDGSGGLRELRLRPLGAGEARENAAGRGLELMVGERTGRFSGPDRRDLESGGERFIWEEDPPATPRVRHVAEVVVREGVASDLQLDEVLEAVPPARDRQAHVEIFLQLAILLGGLAYLVQTQRYHHPHRGILLFGGLTFALAVLSAVVTSGPRLYSGSSPFTVVLGAFLDPGLTRAVAAAFLFAGGRAAVRTSRPALAVPLESLLARLWRARPALSSVAWGLPAGVVIALLPFAFRAAEPLTGILATASEPVAAGSRWPLLVVLAPQMQLAALAAFGLLAPFAYLLRRLWLQRLVLLPLAALLLAPVLPVEGPGVSVLLLALATAAAFDALYRRQGLLAVLVAAWAAGAAARGAALAIQPGPLAVTGWLALLFLVAAAGAAGRTASRSADPGLAEDHLSLRRRLRAERERIKAQLEVAREAQALMLPEAPPQIPGLAISAVCRPAREVGGDLYDFLPAEDGRLGILIGDVSGKGMVASLYMTLTKGLTLAVSEERHEPAEVLRRVNEGLHQQTERGTFVTAWLGLLDPETGHLVHARAGHNPVLWRRTARRETLALKPKGLPLGAVGDRMFGSALEQDEIHLEPGDALFIYSDGLTEAMNARQEEFGDDRLEEIISRLDGVPAAKARDAVLAEVEAFVAGAPQHDDMTLLVLTYKGPGPTAAFDGDNAGPHPASP